MSADIFIPISTWSSARLLSVLSNEDSINLLRKVSSKMGEYPDKLDKLTDEDTSFSNFSTSLAGKLGVIFGSVEGDFLDRIVIQEYAKYMDIFEGDGKVRWGISIRWICNVKLLNVKAKLTSFAAISASVELGFVQSSSRFHVKGINSPVVTANIPTETDLSKNTYHAMEKAFKAIKGEIWNKEQTTIIPTILGIYSSIRGEVKESYREALVIGWALGQIKDGRRLKYALAHSPFTTQLSKDTIKTVYMDVANISSENEKPSDDAKRKANEILGGRRIR